MSYKLESNGYELELTDGIPIPFNFAIADISDISKRARNFSKEIKLEFTEQNRRFFAGNFGFTETENGVSFNPTTRQPCTVSHNGIVTMPNGVLQLKKIVKNNGTIYGTVQIFSEVVDLYLNLAGYTLSDLDWSEYNHTLNITNIQATWSATAGSGYYYPLIDRGIPRPSTSTFRSTDLVPYVYLKEVIEKMFALTGLTVSSTFMNTTRFKNILCGYGGGELATITPTELNNRKVILECEFDVTLVGNEILVPTLFDLQTGVLLSPQQQSQLFYPIQGSTYSYTETQDIYTQHSGGSISIARNGNYQFNWGGEIDVDISITNGTFDYSTPVVFVVFKNGSPIHEQSFGNKYVNSFTETITLVSTLSLNAGDVISWEVRQIRCYWTPTTVGINTQLTRAMSMVSTPLSLTMFSTDTNITDGSDVDISIFLPPTKLPDLLSSVVKHFNLYISDPIDGVVTIEPLSEFYLPTDEFIDISEDVDRGQDVTIEPTGNDFPKTINYKFKDGKDFEFVKYSEKYDTPYGDLVFNQPSYFSKGEKKMELSYATIIPYQIPSTDLILPRFVKSNTNGTIQPNKGELRVMMRNPMKSASWTLTSENGASTASLSTYPLVHHFDNVATPEFDLNFQLPQELYYSATQITNVNSFSEYSSQFINEMISPAGKKITLQNKWTTKQIKDLNFAKLIMLDGALFRLNTITDFDNDTKITAKTELIKVLSADKQRRVGINWVADIEPIYIPSWEEGQKWRGTIYQESTDNPVVNNVNINSMGVSVGATRTATGTYNIDGFVNLSTGTIVEHTNTFTISQGIVITIISASRIQIKTYDIGILADGVLPAPETSGQNFILTVTNP